MDRVFELHSTLAEDQYLQGIDSANSAAGRCNTARILTTRHLRNFRGTSMRSYCRLRCGCYSSDLSSRLFLEEGSPRLKASQRGTFFSLRKQSRGVEVFCSKLDLFKLEPVLSIKLKVRSPMRGFPSDMASGAQPVMVTLF